MNNSQTIRQLVQVLFFFFLAASAILLSGCTSIPAQSTSRGASDTAGRFLYVDDRAVVSWDFSNTQAIDQWRAVERVKIEVADNGVVFLGTGPDPITETRLSQPVKSPLVIRLRCQAEQDSLAQFFWAGPGKGYSGQHVVGQHIHKSKSFATHSIWIGAGQVIDKLRFDPTAGRGRLRVQSISIHPIRIHRSTEHPVLPKPTFRNSVHVVPIHEVFNAARYTDEKRRADIADLLAQCGPPRLYMRLGFSGSTPQLWNKGPVSDIIPLLNEHGLVWHSHHQVSIHNVGRHDVIIDAIKRDRRNAAWRHNGSCSGGAKSWSDKKAFTSEGPGRASVLVCVSRLNRDVIKGRREAARWLNEDMQHARMVREHPYVMVSAGHSVENEMAPAPFPWACYSPYSIEEFQQWLRHTGIYDAKTGDFPGAGQGAQASVVGELLRIKGARRSQFHDDPSPNDANGTGVSFNDYFGTSFDTWKLEYWDLDDFPPGTLPWRDDLSNALPQEGERGNAKGIGFDAPRTPDTGSRFWMAFDNEDFRARGYRQHSVQAFNMDLGEDFVATGFPRERLYSHQIPAEVLGPLVYPNEIDKWKKRPHLLRRFTTASPTWTADDHRGDFGGFGAGITAFHDHAHDEELFKRVSGFDQNWAILEYHPDGHVAKPNYDKCMRSLRMTWRHQVHVLAPGWWNYTKPPFVLKDSDFTRAIRDWFNNPSGHDESDQPWDATKLVDYRPPTVHGVRAVRDGAGVRVRWSPLMWPDVPYAKWSLWREFAGGEFEIHRARSPRHHGARVATVKGNVFEFVDETVSPDEKAYYRVIAVRRKGVELRGEASEAVSAGKTR